MKTSGNKILITGGSSGIGLGLAERFMNEGNTVIICGRREPALKEASDKFPPLITKVCDLSVAAEREYLFSWIAEKHPDLNVLVNNAVIELIPPALNTDLGGKGLHDFARMNTAS